MSGGGGGGAGGRAGGVDGKTKGTNGIGLVSLPANATKLIQCIKEIVNCPESEIYAMLKECDMDPNETIDRFLAQDPFHEVKSKREKKKENKDPVDIRSRGVITSSRGGRGGTEHYGRAIMSQFGTSDSGASHASRPSYKNDNGVVNMSSSHAHGAVGNSISQQPSIASEAVSESNIPAVNSSHDTSSVHFTSSSHTGWGLVSGQVSMADIVKRGKPQRKAHTTHQITSQQSLMSSQPFPTPHEWRSAQNYSSKVSESTPDCWASGNHLIPSSDEWAVAEQSPASSLPSIFDPSIVFEAYANLSGVDFEQENHQVLSDEAQSTEDARISNICVGRNEQEGSSCGVYDNKLYNNGNSYQAHQHDQQEVEEIAANIQQLNMSKEEKEEDQEENVSPREADSPAVKIPEHLRVQSADCSHLSFGSFGAGLTAPVSGAFGARPELHDFEETSAPVVVQRMGLQDTRDTEYNDECLRVVSEENIGHKLAATTGGYEMPSASQSEAVKQVAAEVSPVNQYSFSSSLAKYGFENSQQLSSSFSHLQASSHIQNLPQLESSSSWPSNLPSSSAQPAKEAGLSYSPFSIKESLPDQYSGHAASISSAAISMIEALKSGNFSSTALPSQHHPSGSGVSGGPAFPQHLSVHPYSQPSLPLAAANMMGYSYLPQSYTHMPHSAFQQAFPAGNSTYHQSPTAVLPQYKNGVSLRSLPQSAAVASLVSGYGGFGSSNIVPGGNIPLNSSGSTVAAGPMPPASSMGYTDLLSPQYQEAAQMFALLQGGHGSRSTAAVPGSTHYGFQGHTQDQQQPLAGSGVYRQAQQLHSPPFHTQQYGNLGGYANSHYQSNLSLDQLHQQTVRDGSQPLQAKLPPHQEIWQHTY